MMLRTIAAAFLLTVAMALVAFGSGLFHPGAGLIVGGLLLALWVWLILWDEDDKPDVLPESEDEL